MFLREPQLPKNNRKKTTDLENNRRTTVWRQFHLCSHGHPGTSLTPIKDVHDEAPQKSARRRPVEHLTLHQIKRGSGKRFLKIYRNSRALDIVRESCRRGHLAASLDRPLPFYCENRIFRVVYKKNTIAPVPHRVPRARLFSVVISFITPCRPKNHHHPESFTGYWTRWQGH